LGLDTETARVSPLGRGVVGPEIRALWGEGCDSLWGVSIRMGRLFSYGGQLSAKEKGDGAAAVVLVSL
jgi:hypothetical protein